MGEKVLWESPIYKFRIPKSNVPEEPSDYDEIVIDVTDSAPPFKEPSEDLKSVLTQIFTSGEYKRIDSILEFGAAKLKNLPFILKFGKRVCAVEFRELMESKAVEDNLRKCEAYGQNYERAIFPNPFIAHNKTYDLALLANVLPVMPVYAERLFVLDVLYSKVRTDGFLLWYAQKEGSYKAIKEEGKQSCGDGIWLGKNKRYKTFFKYHTVEDIDEMMALYGFKLKKKFPSGSNDIRLYQKTPYNLFRGLVSSERIMQEIPCDPSIKDPETVKPKRVTFEEDIQPVIPNPHSLTIESLYAEKIRQIPAGEDAEGYHRVISHALARAFRGSLRDMEIKQPIGDGVKIIDTLFTNVAERGFFKDMRLKFECSYPIFEVKNYSDDTKNPEVDQLGGRLNRDRGALGIMVCRKVKDEDAVYRRCATFLPDNCVLFLTDEEIIELLEYARIGNQEEISNFMHHKYRKVLFAKG